MTRELPPRLEVSGMSKRFGTLVALEDVSVCIEPGSVHALLGENGAGKSTLVKCIMGFYQPDAGAVLLDGRPVTIANPKDAQRLGIGMVYQHFTLVENMTVAENLVLSRANVPGIIDWKAERATLEQFMDSMPFRVPLNRYVRQLAAGDKQRLEILKQLYLGSRIIILDEPTSVLTPQEADSVLGMLREMASQKQISVVLITHRFREVKAFADQVTVLRRGRLAGGGDAQQLSVERLAEMMVGSEPPSTQFERAHIEPTEPALELIALEANDDLGLPILRGIDLRVHAGEIVGIAGVNGNGQDELVEVLAGQRPSRSGLVKVNGQEYTPTRNNIRKQRVRLLPEAPLHNACVGQMKVSENMAFRSFDVSPFARAGFFLNKTAMRKRAERAIQDYKIKAPSPDAPIGTLSGGNVQRAVLARELEGDASVLIAANPCFGLDFLAVSEIRTRLVAARKAGTAVLLISADLDEVFALADRIVVMSAGQLVYHCTCDEADIGRIGQHMAGHAA